MRSTFARLTACGSRTGRSSIDHRISRKPEMSDRGSPRARVSIIWFRIPSLSREVTMTEHVMSVFDLSPSEKLQLVEDLWDDLAAVPESVPVHGWQKEELDRRKANLRANPVSGPSWDEVKRRVRK